MYVVLVIIYRVNLGFSPTFRMIKMSRFHYNFFPLYFLFSRRFLLTKQLILSFSIQLSLHQLSSSLFSILPNKVLGIQGTTCVTHLNVKISRDKARYMSKKLVYHKEIYMTNPWLNSSSSIFSQYQYFREFNFMRGSKKHEGKKKKYISWRLTWPTLTFMPNLSLKSIILLGNLTLREKARNMWKKVIYLTS